MRKVITVLLIMSGMFLYAKSSRIERVEPLCWWTEMHCPLTLMFYGEDLWDAKVTVQEILNGKVDSRSTTGLVCLSQHNAESPNYLFVDMMVNKAGQYRITLAKGKNKVTWDYSIYPRRTGSKDRKGFNTSDLVYLLVPDRFVDGNISSNNSSTTKERCDKTNIHGRFGGDIEGIVQSLDYIQSLGVTTIWPTPLLLDDEPEFSYHGYACADYYKVDPRIGTNESYKKMVAEAHAKKMKVIMDMVPNHCGLNHWWMKDLPYKDWVNDINKYGLTNHTLNAPFDIHASQYDTRCLHNGSFASSMPDLNLANKDMLQYLIQMATWWIEYADLDGLRIDTYPYLEKTFGAKWCEAITAEYPKINIVGECWIQPTSCVAYWQKGVRNKDGFQSTLPTVMDFPLSDAIRKALQEDGTKWGEGLIRVHDVLTQDVLYKDVNRLLIFAGNHDMERIADEVKDKNPERVKIAHTLIATLRGIPQMFYGDEYAIQSTDPSKGHSTLRCPLLPYDSLSDEQRDVLEYTRKLFQYRKSEPCLHLGKLMHFVSRDNTYAFFRYNDKKSIFVFINASEESKIIPTRHYEEITSLYQPIAQDIFSHKTYDMRDTTISVKPLSSLILEMKK